MRPFELITTIMAGATLIWISFEAELPGRVSSLLPIASFLLLLVHLKWEGFRWQMIPAYVCLAGLLLFTSPQLSHVFRSRLTYMALIWTAAAVLLGASSILAGIVYPVFRFGPATGSYSVGTQSLYLAETSRLDPYAPDHAAKRDLMLQVWYPGERKSGYPVARYREGEKNGWQDAALALVKTRSFEGLPVSSAQASYPAILFSGPIDRFQNTFQAEELASHGYIVIAVDHSYDSELVVFPDGRRLRKRKNNTFLDFSSEESYTKSTRQVESDVQVRVEDIVRVLDQLAVWNADPHSFLCGRLNLSKTGMFGHSIGGAVTAEICRKDPRVLAGVNLDGWMFGESARTGVPKPFFFMSDCTPRPTAAQLHSEQGESRRGDQRTEEGYEEIERSLAKYGGYYLQAPGLEHMNFSDVTLYSRLKSRTGAGTIDPGRAREMTTRFLLAFFNRYLSETRTPTLRSVAARYPEAHFREVSPRGEVRNEGGNSQPPMHAGLMPTLLNRLD